MTASDSASRAALSLVADERPPAADDACAWLTLRARAVLRRRIAWIRHVWTRAGAGDGALHGEIDLICSGAIDLVAERAFYAIDPAARAHGEAAAAAGLAAASASRWASLLAALELSTREAELLSLCLASHWDPRIGRACGYAQDDLERAGPTFALAAALFDWPTGATIAADGALLRWRLAQPARHDSAASWMTALWEVDPRVAAWLCGEPGLPAELAGRATWLAAAPPPAFEPEAAVALRRVLTGAPPGAVVQLVGSPGVGRRTWTHQICAERNRAVLAVDVPSLVEDGARAAREALIAAEREALIAGAALLWERAETAPAELWRELPFRAPLHVFSVERPIAFPPKVPPVRSIFFSSPTARERKQMWRASLPAGLADADRTAGVLADRFLLTPGDIVRLAAVTAPEGGDALWQACRSLSRGGLHGLATLLPAPYRWDDLVVPDDIRAALGEIAAQVTHRVQVYDDWGFRERLPMGRGITALFCGVSGTGKTMAAQVLAAELGVSLFRIDLAGVVSKYIGETEKNLRMVFDEGERLNAALFFDECDALFGKRSEVKDAHDRYANIEINYLLQRMESYEGLAILATNRRGDLDAAFTRRLRFIVEFPRPSVTERRAIWQRVLPATTPTGAPLTGAIDWDRLARRLEITGAEIKNIALHAAFLASQEGSLIEMRHVARGARRESAKLGRDLSGGEHALIDK
jgi:hypothetical protein